MNIQYIDLHRALTQALIDANIGLPIAHENVDFSPDGLSAFVQPYLMPGDRFEQTKSGYAEVMGVYQIDVNVKSGTSVAAANNAVDSIISHFTDNLTVTSGNVEVIIINQYRSNDARGIPDAANIGAWYSISVTIEFRARPLS